jgi:hypothetical protein
MPIKIKSNNYIYGSSYTGNAHIDKSRQYLRQKDYWNYRTHAIIGNLQNAPLIGPLLSKMEEAACPKIRKRKKALAINCHKLTPKQEEESARMLAKLSRCNPSKKQTPAAENPSADFALTEDDKNNFNAALTFAVACLFPPLMLPFMLMGVAMPMIEQQIIEAKLPEEIRTNLKSIVKLFNPSYLAYPIMTGTLLTQVTIPNLLNPLGFCKILWKISAPGQAIGRIPQTQKQINRSLQGIYACCKNIGTASTVEVFKNLAIHTLNAASAVGSHYVISNLAFQNLWYITTGLANTLPQTWINNSFSSKVPEIVESMNAQCPRAAHFSGWNLLGLYKNPWNTLFSWKESPLWNFYPFGGFDQTKIFSCGTPEQSPSLFTFGIFAWNGLAQYLARFTQQTPPESNAQPNSTPPVSNSTSSSRETWWDIFKDLVRKNIFPDWA